jgi:histidinol-phosphatase (PHP family)
VRWWYALGGDAVVFGSDAHDPDRLAREFPAAAAMVEACGFLPGRSPDDYWRRRAVTSSR